MKTIKVVEIEPIFVEFIPDLNKMAEGEVYISEKYSVSVHKCLCGCGFKTVLPINPAGWIFSKRTNIKGDISVSFSPSILNPDCKAHYIITNNKANFV